MGSSRLVRNIKYYSLGVLASKVLMFLFIPLYSLYIYPEALGKFQYLNSIIALMIPVLYQSIWEGAFRYSIVCDGHEQSVIDTTTKYCIGLSLIYSVLFLLSLSFFKLDYPGYILFTGVSQAFFSYWQFSARALKANKEYALSAIICTVLTVVANIVLIIGFKLQIEALFVSFILGNFAGVIVLETKLHLLRNSMKSKFNVRLLITIIKYSLPLAINSVSWWLVSSCNNIVVTKYLGENANGIMAMAQRFGSIFALFTSIISMAWQEESFRNLKDKSRDDFFNKVLNQYVKLLFSGIMVLIPFTFIIYEIIIFGDYKKGVEITSMLYIIAAFNAITTHLGSEFLARGESNVLFWTTLFTGVSTVLLSVLFINQAGLMGVMYATLLSCIMNFCIRVKMLKGRMHLEINYIQLVTFFIINIFISWLCLAIDTSIWYYSCILIMIFVPSIWYNKEILSFFFSKLLKKHK